MKFDEVLNILEYSGGRYVPLFPIEKLQLIIF